MAAPRKRPKITRKGIHEDLMLEWLGCEKPTNLARNVSSAAEWIDAIIKKQFFAESLNEDEVKTAWKEIAGSFISAHTEPLSVREGHLILRVTQPAMRFHLEQMKPELLRKIREHFGKNRIRSIKFTLG